MHKQMKGLYFYFFTNRLLIMKKIFFPFLLLTAFSAARAQYYYKDLVSNAQVVADMKAYKENKIKKIVLKSFEDDGSESRGFFCEKKLNKNYTKADLYTRADIAAASLFTSTFNGDGILLNTYDSSLLSVTQIEYTYDAKNLITSIKSIIRSKDEDFENVIKEEHFYEYENGRPSKMIRVKNGRDTTDILLAHDDNGNVAIEKDTKNGTKFYYYYDAKNRLTDIVQENEYSKNAKPDYIFEYNNAGLITQMTALEEGSKSFFVWKYNYENGLRIRERCFTDERKLMGSIEYQYK